MISSYRQTTSTGHCSSLLCAFVAVSMVAELCSAYTVYAPPTKYSIPISRKELINELQGLSRKVAQMRSKWYNKASSSVEQFHNPTKTFFVAAEHSKAAVLPTPTVRIHPAAAAEPMVLARGALPITHGQGKVNEAISFLEGPQLGSAETWDFEGNHKVQEEHPIPTEQVDEQSAPQNANIRACLFLRSGCAPVNRLDRARTSAYLTNFQALMNANPSL